MKTFAWTVPEPKHPRSAKKLPSQLQLPTRRDRLRHPLWIASAILFGLTFLLTIVKIEINSEFLSVALSTFSPMIVSLLLGAAAASKRSLLTLLISNALYFAWFLYAYIPVFYVDPDPLAGIVFIVVGFISLPVMIPLWILALCLRHHGSYQISE